MKRRTPLASILMLLLAIQAAATPLFAQNVSRPATSAPRTVVSKPKPVKPATRAPQDSSTSSDEIQGQSVEGEPSITESGADIQARAAAEKRHKKRIHHEFEHEYPDRSGLPSAPGAPEVSHWPMSDDEEAKPNVAQAPQTTSTQFTGATLADTGAFPPDTMGAVGPT